MQIIVSLISGGFDLLLVALGRCTSLSKFKLDLAPITYPTSNGLPPPDHRTIDTDFLEDILIALPPSLRKLEITIAVLDEPCKNTIGCIQWAVIHDQLAVRQLSNLSFFRFTIRSHAPISPGIINPMAYLTSYSFDTFVFLRRGAYSWLNLIFADTHLLLPADDFREAQTSMSPFAFHADLLFRRRRYLSV